MIFAVAVLLVRIQWMPLDSLNRDLAWDPNAVTNMATATRQRRL
jgi:hypothetical protein